MVEMYSELLLKFPHRMDDESSHPIDQPREEALLAKLEAILPDVDAILCSGAND